MWSRGHSVRASMWSRGHIRSGPAGKYPKFDHPKPHLLFRLKGQHACRRGEELIGKHVIWQQALHVCTAEHQGDEDASVWLKWPALSLFSQQGFKLTQAHAN